MLALASPAVATSEVGADGGVGALTNGDAM